MIPRASAAVRRRRKVARAHGRALHGQRRQHLAVDSGRAGQGLPLSPTLQPLAGPEGSTAGGQQSLERRGEHRRRTLRERVEPADVHHDHQDTGRGHQHPRTVDGSGGGAAGGRARLRCRRSNWGSNRNRRAWMRTSGTRACTDATLRGAVRRLRWRGRRIRGRCTHGCSGRRRPAGNSAKQDTQLLDRVLEQSKKMRTQLGAADQARVDEYLSIIRSLETRMERAGDPKRTWKPLVPLTSAPEPVEASGDPSGARPPDAGHDRAGVSERHHADQHVHVRQRGQRRQFPLSGRRHGFASRDLAPLQRSREAAAVRGDQSLARGPVRISAAQAARYEGRRRLRAG